MNSFCNEIREIEILPNQLCFQDLEIGMYLFVANPFCTDILVYMINDIPKSGMDYGWLQITPINSFARMLHTHSNLISIKDSGIAVVSGSVFARTFRTSNDALQWYWRVRSHPSFANEKERLRTLHN